jgi:hypothetical protein
MKFVKYMLIILPMVIFAQETDMEALLTESYDWAVNDVQGIVLAVTPNEINFDEQWLRILPAGLGVESDHATPLTYAELRPPFWAEVSYFKRGQRVYISSLRFLKQLEYNDTGEIIGME